MKNKAAFLAMEGIVLEVVAGMRRGIFDLHETGETDPVQLAKEWISTAVSNLMVERDVQDYVFYVQLVHNDSVFVVGIQQEAKADEDPDKLFFCEVVRLSTASIEAWVDLGKPVAQSFTENELVKLWNESQEYTDSWSKFVELVNKKVKERWL